MADFGPAIQLVLAHEGGYANYPADPVGDANFGVSLRYLQHAARLGEGGYLTGDLDRAGDVDTEDIRVLSRQEAETLYRKQWWDRYDYGRIANQDLATKVFDLAVNMGPRQVHICLQRALLGAGIRVEHDGILGPITVDVANKVPADVVLAALRSEAAGFYRGLGRKTFLKGWLRRAYS